MSDASATGTPSTSEKQSNAIPQTTVLSTGLENLWRSRAQADTIVNVQDQKIHCHRAVLMAASPYFEAMFNSGMKEAISGEIDLQDMEPSTFELVLEFIYTSKDIITQENGCALLEAASLLQIQLLFEITEATLSSNISLETCVDMWRFASMHSSKILKEAAFDFILGQFQELTKQECFKTLNAVELLDIIQDDKLVVPSEEFVVQTVIEWGNFSDVNKTEAGKLFANLRLCRLSHEHLYTMKKHFATDTVDNNIAKNAIDNALYYKHIPIQRQATTSIIAKYRQCDTFEELLVLVGGVNEDSSMTMILEVLAYSLIKRKWFQLTTLPRPCGMLFSLRSAGENMYITGGTLEENLFLQYMGSLNQWTLGAGLQEGRYGHAMVVLSDTMFVFGGLSGHNESMQTVLSIEKYRVDTQIWEKCGNLFQSIVHAVVSVYDNKVLLCGGLTDVGNPNCSQMHQSLLIQCFDTITNSTSEYAFSELAGVAMDAVQSDCFTYIADPEGKIGKFEFKCDGLERKSEMFKAISRNSKEEFRLVQKDGMIIVCFLGGEGDHLKQMLVINPETGEECMPPVLYPYPRSVGGCVKLTVQKKFLTMEKQCSVSEEYG